VYISVDLDVFDPSLMPAVGTPEPGGMAWEQVVGLLRAVAEARQIVGFDVVELCPREGPAACAFTAARLVYKLIGYALLLGEQPSP
jgi:agmatinase